MRELAELGLQELSEEEARELNGGGDIARWRGRVAGAVVGVIAEGLDNYENPRYSGDWQG